MPVHFRPRAAVQPSPDQLAQWCGGRLRHPERAPARLAGLATLDAAGPDEIAFITHARHIPAVDQCAAGLIVTTDEWDLGERAQLIVDEVWGAVATLMARLYPRERPAPGVHPTAVVDEAVELGADVHIGPYCIVRGAARLGDGVELGPHCVVEGEVSLGAGTRLVARVTVLGPAEIGSRVLIHPGAVIGADGFKFEPVGGAPLKIPQVGIVVLEDDVEIGANTTIDRAFLYETRVGAGTKIDNLVQVAHNVRIGPGCILAAQVGIAGSTQLGAGCMVGGSAGLADNLTIGDRVMIGAYAGVHTDWPSNNVLLGQPAMPIRQFWRMIGHQKKLGEYAKRLQELEAKIQALEAE